MSATAAERAAANCYVERCAECRGTIGVIVIDPIGSDARAIRDWRKRVAEFVSDAAKAGNPIETATVAAVRAGEWDHRPGCRLDPHPPPLATQPDLFPAPSTQGRDA